MKTLTAAMVLIIWYLHDLWSRIKRWLWVGLVSASLAGLGGCATAPAERAATPAGGPVTIEFPAVEVEP